MSRSESLSRSIIIRRVFGGLSLLAPAERRGLAAAITGVVMALFGLVRWRSVDPQSAALGSPPL